MPKGTFGRSSQGQQDNRVCACVCVCTENTHLFESHMAPSKKRTKETTIFRKVNNTIWVNVYFLYVGHIWYIMNNMNITNTSQNYYLSVLANFMSFKVFCYYS